MVWCYLIVELKDNYSLLDPTSKRTINNLLKLIDETMQNNVPVIIK